MEMALLKPIRSLAAGLAVILSASSSLAATPPAAPPASAPGAAPSSVPAAASAPAAGGAEARPGDAGDTEVRGYLRLGETAFQAGRFAEAEEWFEKAFALRPGYDVASNLAAAEQAQRKHREAAAHFAHALRTFPATADPEKKRPLEQRFRESRAKVGAIRVTVHAAGAEILVAGQVVAKSPTLDPVFVEPGTVELEARLGTRRARESVTIGAGAEQDVELVLGGEAASESSGSALPVVAGVGFGLGGAGLVAAIVLTVVASGKASDAHELSAPYKDAGTRCPGGCADLRDAFAKADTSYNAATGLWIASGILLVGTAMATAALAASTETTAPPALALTPAAGPGCAGLVASGRF
jgi:tetratricopeptide (TPR) repeat protein